MDTHGESTEHPERPVRSESGWAFRIATVAGIPIRIHVTFLMVLLWVAVASNRQTPNDYLRALVLVLGIFFCVVLHELGHALVAKRFGVQTRDITLYPIGGVAMLQGRNPKPREEFWIALAGPAVNVGIALILGSAPKLTDGKVQALTTIEMIGANIMSGLFAANVILPAFNMIPAFPMDGGRVLRAALAMNMSEERATRIAGGIGQFLAVAMGFFGVLTGQLPLMLIAFFVYLGAGQEVSAIVGRTMVYGHRMADAMITQFSTLESGQTLEGASRLLLQGSQQDFPVTIGDQVLGVLTRDNMIKGLALEGPTAYVSGHMLRDYKSATPEEPLEHALEVFSQGDGAPILIMNEGHLLGMVTRDNFGEFLMLEHVRALSRRRGYAR